MRKHFIDNLRWMAVILLFPYHVFMIYNNWGEQFYINVADNVYLSNFIVLVWPWFMPLMFVLAGISTVYALEKRTSFEYIKERFLKLFIPLFFGILFIVPCMTFLADKYHNGYSGNYFQHYIKYFTKATNFSGSDGCFTPGHLWFILYLFVISIIVFPVVKLVKISIKKINIFILLLLFILPLCGKMILNISGKSFGEYFCFFIIGYFILSNESILKEAGKYWYIIFLLFFGSLIFIFSIFNKLIYVNDIIYDIVSELYGYNGILLLMIIGEKFLNKNNTVFTYFSKSSFGVYIFHQLWIIITAYIIVAKQKNILIQIIIILLMSIILTYGTCELCKSNKITRFMFGIKK